MKNPISIRIEKPCHEDWDQMTPTEQGRFCGACRKNVIDFSTMTDNEILEFLNQHTGSMCGQLRGSQLNRAIVQTRLQGSNWKLNSFVTALLVAGGAGIASAQTAPPVNNQKVIIDQKNPTGPVCVKTTSEPVSNTLKAVVYDTIGQNVMPYATITIANTNISTQADEHGKFMLVIPADSLTAGSVTLWIYKPGYMREVYTLDTKDIAATTKLELGFEERMMKGEMIVAPHEK